MVLVNSNSIGCYPWLWTFYRKIDLSIAEKKRESVAAVCIEDRKVHSSLFNKHTPVIHLEDGRCLVVNELYLSPHFPFFLLPSICQKIHKCAVN
jgi:hypothetical protein